MDARPIGIFDSGLGGLTAMTVLSRLLPGEDLIYFGDTGRMPYGTKTKTELLKIARQDIDFLRDMGAKLILAACGTVSTVALPILTPISDIPVFGVIEPAAREAVRRTRAGKIGVIATQATIAGGEYVRVLKGLSRDLEIIDAACPKLTPLVESGRISAKDAGVMAAVEEYLTPIKAAGVDTLLLGCTHYPLLESAIRAFLGDDIEHVSAGEAAALELVAYLESSGLGCGKASGGSRHYYTSGSREAFSVMAGMLLGNGPLEGVQAIEPFPL